MQSLLHRQLYHPSAGDQLSRSIPYRVEHIYVKGMWVQICCNCMAMVVHASVSVQFQTKGLSTHGVSTRQMHHQSSMIGRCYRAVCKQLIDLYVDRA